MISSKKKHVESQCQKGQINILNVVFISELAFIYLNSEVYCFEQVNVSWVPSRHTTSRGSSPEGPLKFLTFATYRELSEDSQGTNKKTDG